MKPFQKKGLMGKSCRRKSIHSGIFYFVMMKEGERKVVKKEEKEEGEKGNLANVL